MLPINTKKVGKMKCEDLIFTSIFPTFLVLMGSIAFLLGIFSFWQCCLLIYLTIFNVGECGVGV